MTIIAERVLTLLETDGSKCSVPARIFAPREDDGTWFCDVEIAWRRVRSAWRLAESTQFRRF